MCVMPHACFLGLYTVYIEHDDDADDDAICLAASAPVDGRAELMMALMTKTTAQGHRRIYNYICICYDASMAVGMEKIM